MTTPDRDLSPDEGAAPVGQAAEVVGTARATGGVRVLVIDDEPEIRRAVRTGLAGAHFTVEGATTGAQGMDLVARWHPDVIILDLSLPDMDGVEVCRQLRGWS